MGSPAQAGVKAHALRPADEEKGELNERGTTARNYKRGGEFRQGEEKFDNGWRSSSSSSSHSRMVELANMTNRLKALIGRIEHWPKKAQDEAVNSLLAIEGEYLGGDDLSVEDRAALMQSAEDFRLDRFANDEDVREAFNRYHRA